MYGYGYGPVAGAGYDCGYGYGPVAGVGHCPGKGFALIVVLFILLIIIGASWGKC
ncbi:YjcZ family sporulation protein [Halalkalibacterium halodurans]|uniref:BH2184 protein n=1 Tax=Halalkalibacterium halodurans (strain ATCC BAA-125 / DSM 18197 / FERM 7344 / JCM 9153 / C-125) TaxID=272558 RepID=Q9KAV2_HALH5|nr:YjcZ family sporulation protein [Halalkalibacterium halodurans]MDY7222740.1 YjcZ family sporulation protein [Halalkalibacterium halodurans]MDY7241961.1 YjcZ family sporulation protein [Halalkalibacterium halodurans]MED3646953.1 YjcZ family sporulation protein [Halalkalibacterium halodurans]MED4082774.1 YjcZ family sporulation protein [Halalkalibacterium halodurans]MED4087256.1 YjcZ family sporulation protein [Halalkalibacterium halodurans]